jgi:hypothetical protein
MPFDVAMLEAFLLALVCGVLIGFVGIGGVLEVSVLNSA